MSVQVMCWTHFSLRKQSRLGCEWSQQAVPVSLPTAGEGTAFVSCSGRGTHTCFSCPAARLNLSANPSVNKVAMVFMITLRICLKWGSSTTRGRCWDPTLPAGCFWPSTHHPLFFFPVSCIADSPFCHAISSSFQDQALLPCHSGPRDSHCLPLKQKRDG